MIEDIKNKRFGRLVALEATDQRDCNHCILWKCKCDCGNVVLVPSRNLRNGKAKSCGCLQKEKVRKKNVNSAVDLIGQRFGKLVVIEKTNKRNHEHVVWKCKCDCGNECYVPSHYLRNGETSSCGCICSKGEQKIADILKAHNIRFERQKTFDGCRFKSTNLLARFDFYLPDYNILIEYDGQQHFTYGNNGWNTKANFIKRKERDEFKNSWCEEHGIKLIRIPYTKYETLSIGDLL